MTSLKRHGAWLFRPISELVSMPRKRKSMQFRHGQPSSKELAFNRMPPNGGFELYQPKAIWF